jgi:hypothetical protein
MVINYKGKIIRGGYRVKGQGNGSRDNEGTR